MADEVEPIRIYLLGWSPEDAIVRGYVFDSPEAAKEYAYEVEEEDGGLYKMYEIAFIPPPEALEYQEY